MSFRLVVNQDQAQHIGPVAFGAKRKVWCGEGSPSHLEVQCLALGMRAQGGSLTYWRNSWVVLDHCWSHWSLLCDSVSMVGQSGEHLLVMAIWLVVAELPWRKWPLPFQQLTESTCVLEQLCFSMEMHLQFISEKPSLPSRCNSPWSDGSSRYKLLALKESWCIEAKMHGEGEGSRKRVLAWIEC